MVKISFILPCYNVAPYVGRCIESIETQDIPQEEYEVICVDDCSKDNTVEVIEQYQARYSNVQLVRHEVNQTAGGARNTGVREAKGEYLWFVDPDDAVFPNVLKAISDKIEALKVEILFFNYQTQNETGETYDSRYPLFDGEMSGVDYIKNYAHGAISLYSSIYSCVFLREYLVKNQIVYPKLRAGQDVVFKWRAILNCKHSATIDTICYKYIRRSDSVTGSKGSLTARAIMSQSLLFAYEIHAMLQEKPNIDASIRNHMINAIRCALNDDSRNILYANHKEQKSFYEMLQQEAVKIREVQNYMNRKTQNIFRYSSAYLIWRFIISGYKLNDALKHKSSKVIYE